jgi:hypothetical protein
MGRDTLLQFVFLKRRQMFASEGEVQSRCTFVSVCSPERTFFALKFGKFLIDCAHEMFARRLANPCAHNSASEKAVTVLQ